MNDPRRPILVAYSWLSRIFLIYFCSQRCRRSASRCKSRITYIRTHFNRRGERQWLQSNSKSQIPLKSNSLALINWINIIQTYTVPRETRATALSAYWGEITSRHLNSYLYRINRLRWEILSASRWIHSSAELYYCVLPGRIHISVSTWVLLRVHS